MQNRNLSFRQKMTSSVSIALVPASLMFGCANLESEKVHPSGFRQADVDKATAVMNRAMQNVVCSEENKIVFSPLFNPHLEISVTPETTAQMEYERGVWVVIRRNTPQPTDPKKVTIIYEVTFEKNSYFLGSPVWPSIAQGEKTVSVEPCSSSAQ